jgi:hypothetical protein|nr:MAG TPA: hypothetical protein [Caudoviricetes sp.]
MKKKKIQEIYNEIAEYENKRFKEYQTALEYFKNNIDYPFDEIEEVLEADTLCHIGYCDIERDHQYKSWEYPTHEFYRLTEDSLKEYPSLRYKRFMLQDKMPSGSHNLVWQETLFEDCYHGYILLPLKDGRYWIVEYEC